MAIKRYKLNWSKGWTKLKASQAVTKRKKPRITLIGPAVKPGDLVERARLRGIVQRVGKGYIAVKWHLSPFETVNIAYRFTNAPF